MSKERKEKIIIFTIIAVLIIIFAAVTAFLMSKGIFKTKDETTSTATSSVSTTETEEVTIPLSSIKHEFQTNDVVGKIVSKDLDISCDLYWGTTKECLRNGAGIHKCSSLPGLTTPLTRSATCPIVAGHCTTDFENFKKLDPKSGEFKEGLTITFEMPYGDYVYEIKKVEIIDVDDFEFRDYRASFGNFDPNIALFYTCYPFETVNYTKNKRLFLYCELISGTKVIDDTLGAYESSTATEGVATF